MTTPQTFDRRTEDLCNIVRFGHLNLEVPDQYLAQAFYVSTLGLTRDPYAQTDIDNMWINIGCSQFHLPTGKPSRMRGHAGLVMPDRTGLLQRLAAKRPVFKDTHYAYIEHDDCVEVICPWGNHYRIHEPAASFYPLWLGIAYVVFDVPVGTAQGIARFYEQVMLAIATVSSEHGLETAKIQVGEGQHFIFREKEGEPAPYDGHHLQVYAAQFSKPHQRLMELGLITQENSRHLYRFTDIKDPADGRVLFSIEHEVRSMTHPLFLRPLINRNPATGQRNYSRGVRDDDWSGPPWKMPV